jgi:chromate transporter
MLPGLLLMLALSWAYVSLGLRSAAASSAFAGVQAAVVALVLRAAIRIGRHALGGFVPGALAAASFAAAWLGAHFALAIAGAALIRPLARRRRWGTVSAVAVVCAAAGAWSAGSAPAAREAAVPTPGPAARAALPQVAAAGLRTGLLTFGGAYTAVPILEHDAVGGGWMSRGEFLDGIALGGVLPAPLIIFGTFVGFVAAGWAGALLLTLGVFLPAFLFTLLGHGVFERLTRDPRLRDALDGVMAAVVGLIAATLLALGREALGSVAAWAIAALALLGLSTWRSRAAVPCVILGAGAAGLLLGLA